MTFDDEDEDSEMHEIPQPYYGDDASETDDVIENDSSHYHDHTTINGIGPAT